MCPDTLMLEQGNFGHRPMFALGWNGRSDGLSVGFLSRLACSISCWTLHWAEPYGDSSQS